MTALNLEYRAVRAHLTELVRSVHRSGTVFEVGYLSEVPVGIVLAHTGEGNAAAAALAAQTIEVFAPRALVFVGVAGALKDDLETDLPGGYGRRANRCTRGSRGIRLLDR
jgi:nucleoside phosphorylase